MWIIVFNIQFTVNIQLGVIFPKTNYSSKVIRDLPLSYLNILASPTRNVHGQISILKYEGMMEKVTYERRDYESICKRWEPIIGCTLKFGKKGLRL